MAGETRNRDAAAPNVGDVTPLAGGPHEDNQDDLLVGLLYEVNRTDESGIRRLLSEMGYWRQRWQQGQFYPTDHDLQDGFALAPELVEDSDSFHDVGEHFLLQSGRRLLFFDLDMVPVPVVTSLLDLLANEVTDLSLRFGLYDSDQEFEIRNRDTQDEKRAILSDLLRSFETLQTSPDWRQGPHILVAVVSWPTVDSHTPAETASAVADLPVVIYLSDETIHEQVEAAVDELLARANRHIVWKDTPVIGSWFRAMRATLAQLVRSPAGREAALSAAHAADSRLILAQDAYVTATFLQNLGPVITSLQPTKDAVLRVGALLIVKVDWTVQVFQLTAAQQITLDHRPQLATRPHEIIEVLQLSTAETSAIPSVHDREVTFSTGAGHDGGLAPH
jgi:hypothetical protein